MRRSAALAAVVAACALSAPAGAAVPGLGTWDRVQQRTVQHEGLLPALADGRFHGERPLTPPELTAVLAGLAQRLGGDPVPFDRPTVTVERFHRALLEQLGLGDVARNVREEAARAGLRPPFRFGSEAVARALGLRFDHPFPAGERLELRPTDLITRAEAAWSLAVVLGWQGWEAAAVRDAFAAFDLPAYTPRQRAF